MPVFVYVWSSPRWMLTSNRTFPQGGGPAAEKRCCRVNTCICKKTSSSGMTNGGLIFSLTTMYFWNRMLAVDQVFKGPRVMKFTQLINDHVSVQTEEEKGRRGKLQLHGFHLTAAVKSWAVLWPISRARRGRKTVPITVSPITGHSTATAVNTRRVMVCIGIFSLMFSHIFQAEERVCCAAQLWAKGKWLSTFNTVLINHYVESRVE